MTAAPHRSILPTLLLLLCGVLPALAQTAGAGVSFVAALPTTAPASDPLPTTVTLLLASETGTTVSMIPSNGAPTKSVTIPAGGTIEEVLDSATVLAPGTPGLWRSSLRLAGTAPFTATLLIDRQFAVEAVALTPDAEQQREAFLVSSDVNENGGVMIVIGLLDSTRVTITPSVPTADGHPARVPYTLTLGLGDVYQTISASAGSEGDLTGTRVESSVPVGVIGGTICTNFPIGADHACNPLVEAMPPVGCLGREFILAPLAKQTHGRARLVATRDGTSVTLAGTLPLGTLARGEYLDLSADTAVRIVASAPVVVMQYLTSTATGFGDLGSPYGDPSMMAVPPVESEAREVRTVLPTLGPRTYQTGTAGWDYYLQVVCDSAAFGSIRVNGAPPLWSRVDGTEGYRLGVMPLGPGDLTVTCDSSIGLQFYAYSLQDAFGTTPFSCAVQRPVEPEPERDTSRYLRLRLLGDTVPVGARGAFELVLDSAKGFLPGDSLAFDLVAAWNRSVAVPVHSLERVDSSWSVEFLSTEVVSHERQVVLRFHTVVDTSGTLRFPSTLARLPIIAALGDELTWVSITPKLSARPHTVDTAGGLLRVVGQCVVGGRRLVAVGEPLLRTVVVDREARAVEVVPTGESLGCVVALVDPLGREAHQLRSSAPGALRFAGLSAGWYLLTARTSDGRQELRVVVIP